jgi:enoyl-CoA hydratase/carnithine racemase
MALLGRIGYTAEQMREWGIVNFVVGEGKAVEEAVKLAEEIAGNSPDAVIASREGLRLGWEGIGPQMGTEVLERGMYGRIDKGENMKEGVRSFVEKRKPVWKDSKL